MTIKDCYARMDANYNDALRRLMTDERIEKFLHMMLRDNNFSELQTALEKQDYETAFRCAHTLKGISLNLGLTRLAEADCKLTEALRSGQEKEEIPFLFDQVKQQYLIMQAAINELADSVIEKERQQ